MVKDKKTKNSTDTMQKTNTKQEGAGGAVGASGIWQDARFHHLLTDPRFRGVPKTQRKVKIDKRFEGMFTDDKFKVKYTVDKYGRRINKSNADDLRKYYELDDSTDDDEKEQEKDGTAINKVVEQITKAKAKDYPIENEKEKKKKTEKKVKSAKLVVDKTISATDQESDDEEEAKERRAEELAISRQSDEEIGSANDDNDELGSDGEIVPKTIRERLLDPNIDYARGEGRLVTDSSSDDDSSDDDDDNGPELQIDHVWGELDNDAETTEDSTRRLAVCNMDWDRIRAQDIMILLSSFLPLGGNILSVRIYPSEFGKARMAEEDMHGPTELVGAGNEMETKKENIPLDGATDDDDSDEDSIENGLEQDSDAEEGDDYHMEKLRQYQLNRLRYYYAVVECDSVATADKIYKECDGIEYESSATRVDLRFIPDDTTFEDDVPTDVCKELPDMNMYKPRQFTTTALQQAKVDLTWDETALERRELGDKLSSGKLDQVSDKDLRQIVAYSSEEEEDDDDGMEAVSTEKDIVKTQTENQVSVDCNKEDKPLRKLTKKEKLKESISKYQALLTEINENESKKKKIKDYEMELTWDVEEPAHKKEDEDAVEQSSKASVTQAKLTPIEKVLAKRSEKNKKRKEERRRKKLEAAGLNPDDDDANQSDDDSLPDGIDLNDPYFAEEFANGDFIEPKSTKTKSKQQQKKSGTAITDSDKEEEERRAKELELLIDDDNEDQFKQHFSLTKIMKADQESSTSKRKRRKQLKKAKSTPQEVEDNFNLNVADPRFSAVYSSHVYNIDPTDSHFKKTKGMDQIIQEKLKRRHEQTNNKVNDNDESISKRPKKHLESIMLAKSLKRKIQQTQAK